MTSQCILICTVVIISVWASWCFCRIKGANSQEVLTQSLAHRDAQYLRGWFASPCQWRALSLWVNVKNYYGDINERYWIKILLREITGRMCCSLLRENLTVHPNLDLTTPVLKNMPPSPGGPSW